MRAATLATLLALSAAPAAQASFGPPLVEVPSTLRSVPIVHLGRAEARPPSSCIVHARHSTGVVRRVERKLAPVACEQPPRSRVSGTGFGFFFRVTP